MSDPRWTAGKACRPEDLELFYPTGRPGRFGDPNRGAEAKAICARCPIRERCLTEALIEEARGGGCWGIRGGLDEDQREALMKAGAA